MIIAIDPGTKTGVTITDGKTFETMLWNLATKPKTKKRPAEPKHFRLLKLLKKLQAIRPDKTTWISTGGSDFPYIISFLENLKKNTQKSIFSSRTIFL